MDYVDVIFAHRPDHTSTESRCPQRIYPYSFFVPAPMVETVRAFDWLINQGLVSHRFFE